MEYYSVVKKKILAFVIAWIHLENIMLSEISPSALTGVAQWTECQPENQKVTSLIPSQGTCLDCGPGPQLGACKRQLVDVSLTH